MPVLRFHLLDLYYSQVAGGFIVTVTTNAACHLYLRYSDVFPHIHRKSVLRRGLVMGWDARYCFVAYHHIEQNEAGDTFTHTFTWPGWSNCEKRYFYFWGTMGGQDMVSDTPIFWLHYTAPPFGPPVTAHFHPDKPPGITCCDGVAGRVQYGASWPNLHEGAGTSGTSDTTIGRARITSWDVELQWHLIERAFFLFDTSSIPEGSIIISAILHLYGTDKINTLVLDAALNVFTSWPTTNTDIIAADYQKLDMVALATKIPYADFKTMDWNHLVFTEAGLIAIIPNGITKLAIREANYDATYVRPPWRSYKHMWMEVSQSVGVEERWADLEVTYQPPL